MAGLSRTPEAFAKDVAGLHVGDPSDKTKLEEAVARLIRTGRFISVDYRVEDAEGGVDVIFDVREQATVAVIRTEGNKYYAEKKLLAEVDQKKDRPVDWFAVRDGRESILRLYREAGFPNVAVAFDEKRVQQRGELVYEIDEGKRVRVRKILFEGNPSLTRRELKGEIETETAFWFIRTGAFDPDVAEADAGRIQNYYRDQGFLDAKVAFRTESKPDGESLWVTFSVEEGVRYRIENITFEGNAALSVEELSTLIRSKVDEVVKRPTVDADAKAVQTRYGELGYIYATVRPVRIFSDTPERVRITIQTTEGEQFHVGRIGVRGNARTKDKVVRRALNLYPPDDLFNLTEAKDAERRLLETRIFSAAKVIPVGDQPGVRDAIIDVTETEKVGDFLFGVGITSNSGLVGSVVLDLQNFDISDRPRNLSELFKLRAFQGAGQRLRIELQPGSEVSRYRIDFTEPYLFDKPIRFDSSVYLFERGRDGYDEGRVGSLWSLGKRFEKGILRGWSGEVAFRSEIVDVDDVNLFASGDIRDVQGSNWLGSVKGSLVRDRTDSRFVPTTGDRLRLSYEQFYGDHFFGKIGGEYNRFHTLAVDRLDRKHVFHWWTEGGGVAGDAPVFERYYAGGTGSIRGFAYRGIGERDGIDRNNVGGDYLILLGGEYSYPLYGKMLRGHVFLDTGTAGAGAYRGAVGTGVRFTLDLLGPLPIELNLAMPVAGDADDDEQIFSFVVGSVF